MRGTTWRFWLVMAVWAAALLATHPPWWWILLGGAVLGFLTAVWEDDVKRKRRSKDQP